MEDIRNMILRDFDIRKFKIKCNFPGCEAKPEREVYISEYTIKRRIGIGNLYLCKEHLPSARELVRKIKQIHPDKIIERKIKPMRK